MQDVRKWSLADLLVVAAGIGVWNGDVGWENGRAAIVARQPLRAI